MDYISDENALIEWESNGLERVSPDAMREMISEIEDELAKRGEQSKYRATLENIAAWQDSDDRRCLCWGIASPRANRCPMCMAKEALSA